MVCGACGLHVMRGESNCRYCEAPLSGSTVPTVAALLLGLSIAACSGDGVDPQSSTGASTDAQGSTSGSGSPWPASETCSLQPSYGGPCTQGWPPDGGYETTGPVDPTDPEPTTNVTATDTDTPASATDTDPDTDSATATATDTDTATDTASVTDSEGACDNPPCLP